ncbi:Gag-Pol polyprotein [Elysia marginata]|uniref:Gag-Pol polyprotein n=1 Tax=Elysia marginata TaxID=1093978 RepID=A0AAV4HP58_9GAST|nr:Gag-Pol polyprotein [Elysia marginata]
MTIIDRTTRWPEAIPLNNTSTTDCARALIRHWISRFGAPLDITLERGSQFTSTLWNEIARLLEAARDLTGGMAKVASNNNEAYSLMQSHLSHLDYQIELDLKK